MLEKMFVKARIFYFNPKMLQTQWEKESSTAERCKYRAVENFDLQLPYE
jgi:hypothetical protein